MFIDYCLPHVAKMKGSQGEESLSLVHGYILMSRVEPGIERVINFCFLILL